MTAAPSTGLVLGAGGVVGHAWHAGVLSGLAEATGWDPRTAAVVVGTSAGSVVGAFLRAGMSAADLHARVVGKRLSDDGARMVGAAPDVEAEPFRIGRLAPGAPGLLARLAVRPWEARLGTALAAVMPRGRVSPAMLGDSVRRAYDGRPWPGDPFWACTVRLGDGRRVVLGRDPVDGGVDVEVGRAVEASSAIPGYFEPVAIGGHDHVDGGAHSPTNADVLATGGHELVIVSSPMSSARSSTLGVGFRAAVRARYRLILGREVAALRARGATVITLQPSSDDLRVMGRNAMDPSRRAEVAEQARLTTMRRLGSPALRDTLGPLTGR